MKRDKSFHDYVVYDILGDEPAITSKAMFGGWGIYQNGVVFGIITGGQLYFKVDDGNRSEFEAIDSHPFVYAKKSGKSVALLYWLVPEEVMEDREKFHDLMRTSVAASKRKH